MIRPLACCLVVLGGGVATAEVPRSTPETLPAFLPTPAAGWMDAEALVAGSTVGARLLEEAAAPVVRGQSEDGGGGGGDLASKSQNPISDLVSLPFQANWNYGLDGEAVGGNDRTQFVGNLQPVVPVSLGEDWTLVNRIIIPFVNTPVGGFPPALALPGTALPAGFDAAFDDREHGLGDVIGQFFITPKTDGPLTIGLGPNFVAPTSDDRRLGAGLWGGGINGVALISEGPIVAGALVTQTWTEGGQTKPFLFQPFFNYNLPEGWFVSLSGEVNADWEQPRDSRFSIPFGPGVGRVFPILGQPVNANVRFAPYLDAPDGGPEWQFRFVFSMLFPKA